MDDTVREMRKKRVESLMWRALAPCPHECVCADTWTASRLVVRMFLCTHKHVRVKCLCVRGVTGTTLMRF